MALDGSTYTPQQDCSIAPALCFKFFQDPVMQKTFPTSGPAQGGTRIDITGSGFFNTSQSLCRFGTTKVALVFLNSTNVMCFAPSHVAQVVDLYISANGFDFLVQTLKFEF
ncbi:hypothetical protein GUITHDRAFT_64685, partial [Guillardia theta CCMP2712]